MKSGIPWSVKGIEPGVREAAKDAARRSGLTLGEWLNNIILEQAEGMAAPPQATPTPPKGRFDSIAEELALMTAQRPQTASRYHNPVPAQQSIIDFDSLIDRIENSERYFTDALSSINERITAATTELGKLGEQAQARSESGANYEALETALRNIVGHLEISERRTHDVLTSVQERLSTLDSARLNGSVQHAGRLENLEELIAQFSERVDRQLEEQAGKMPSNVKSQLANIDERLAALQANSNKLKEEAKAAALEAVGAEMRDIERQMQSLASHAQSGLKQSTEWRGEIARLQADFARLKADIGQFNQRMDAAREEAATQHDVQSLQGLIEELSQRVSELPAGDVEQRLSEAMRRISDMEIRGRALPQFGEVMQRVEELEERLAQERIGPGLQQELDELREQMLGINGMLAETGERLSSMDNIERSISQLFQALEDNRDDVQELAEEAARRVLQELLRDQPQSADAGGDVEALEQALGALRQQCIETDQQTEETFGALHDTLEEIINKVTSLEAGQMNTLEEITNKVTSLEAGQINTLEAITNKVTSLEAGQMNTLEEIINKITALETGQIAAAAAAEASAGRATEPALSSAFPGETQFAPFSAPNFAEPVTQTWQNAVQEHLAKAQVDLGEHEPRPEPAPQPEAERQVEDPARDLFIEPEAANNADATYAASEDFSPKDDDDFIAAARRAAQAAAQGSRLGIGKLPFAGPQSDGRRAKVKGGFSFSLFRRSPALKPRHPRGVAEDIAAAADSATLPPETGRRRLLLAALLLLAAVSAYALRGQKELPRPVEPQRNEIQQPTPAPAPEKSGLLQPQSDFGAPLPLPHAIGPPNVRMAAENGQAEAQFVVAERYSEGSLVGQNHGEAAKWYYMAARQGLAPAQFRLAALFERGNGVKQDLGKARFWYRAAAAQGNVKAMHNLAVLLMDQAKPDHAGAAQWFTEAAGYGLRDSQYNLGLLYERGIGVKENPAEACFWYLIAASQGDKDALARVRAIEVSLPAAASMQARDRVQRWKPKNSEREANVVSLALAQG